MALTTFGAARARWRRHLPLLGLVTLLGLVLVVAATQVAPPTPTPFDPASTQETGLRGLYLWLERLGYRVQRNDGLRFEVPEHAALVFVYPNRLPYTAEEAATLRDWVVAGGTLVLIGPDPADSALEEAFGVRATVPDGFGALEMQVQPLIPEGRREYVGDWRTNLADLDLSAAPAAVPVLIDAEGNPTLAVQPVGRGVVWHLSPANGLTNGPLRDSEQGAMLPPILRTVPAGGLVVFDTFHLLGLSRIGERIETLQDWLYRTPTGWAVLFGVATLGLFWVLQGRRLGPALVTATAQRRREAAEYVTAMANLARRAQLVQDVALHHKQRLKRGLAHRYTVQPDLPDAVFLDQLAAVRPALAEEQMVQVRRRVPRPGRPAG